MFTPTLQAFYVSCHAFDHAFEIRTGLETTLDKHWQQIEQAAIMRMATYHQERARAHHQQQFVTQCLKVAVRKVQHFRESASTLNLFSKRVRK
jgi:hypothetical protein